MKDMCKCASLARVDGFKTFHHPNCPHYNEGLIDVWKVTVDGQSCYTRTEQEAKDMGGSVFKEKMHIEVFERLPEFTGF